MDIERVERALLAGREMEEILENIEWKDFEKFCSDVLEAHEWKTLRNFRFSSGKRYEIDIVAMKGNRVLCIDCKHWGIRPGKKTQLRYAAEKQKERTKEASRIMAPNFMNKGTEYHPVLITLWQEEITKENDVWIVPAFRLNNFMLEAENHL